MKPHLECESCLMRQAREAIAFAGGDPKVGIEVRQLINQLDWSLPPPVLGQRVHRLIREVTRCADPYASVKERLNRRAEELYPVWHRRFRAAHPPLEAAVRLAIVGNLLDVGAKTQLSDSAVLAAFEDGLTAPLLYTTSHVPPREGTRPTNPCRPGPLTRRPAFMTPCIGSVEELSEALRRARDILVLADNAGEIVFDRDLLAQLPLGHFAVAVRGSPVLNDATIADARWAGLETFCEVLSNGSDAPGTLLEDCSPEFRRRFAEADLILAKGQGNYESLAGVDKPIFFLLKVKCAVLAEALQCPVGSLVLHRQRPSGKSRLIQEEVRP